jgi:hypothetical protein
MPWREPPFHSRQRPSPGHAGLVSLTSADSTRGTERTVGKTRYAIARDLNKAPIDYGPRSGALAIRFGHEEAT